MANGITFSGISSGLNTTDIIKQLMQVESVPQTQLKNKVTAEQSQLTSLQQLNTALASIGSSADSFATGSTWTQLKASSSNTAVSVTASSAAVQSTMSIVVDRLASAASMSFAPAGGSTPTVAPAATEFTIFDAAGKAVSTFDSGTGSPADIAKAINATSAKSNLRAVVTNSDAGPILQITSTKTGDPSAFSIVSTDAATTLVDASTAGYAAGQRASMKVNGAPLSSDSNTVEVATGVTVTLGAGAVSTDPTKISVSDDGTSRAAAMKTFIDQINGVLTTIGTMTSYGTVPTDAGTAAKDSGILPGDSTLRALADQLVSTIFPSAGGTTSGYGISVDRYGKLTFDSAKFTAAYAADPAGTQAAVIGTGTDLHGTPLSESFVSRMQKVVANATYSASGAASPFVTGKAADYDGMITSYIKSFQSEISDLNDNIAAWDDRLAMKQASLQTIYTNLETVMSKLSAQSSWLASQIDGLPDLNNKS